MRSHSKSNIFKRLTASCFALIVCAMAFAQNDFLKQCINLTVQPVPPPYTNRLEDYFSKSGKIGGTMLINLNIQEYAARSLDFYVHVSITNIETEQGVGTKSGFRPSRPRNVILAGLPKTVPLQFSDLQEAMSEPNLEYRYLTKEQVQRDGLPAGTYQIFMQLFVQLSNSNNYERVNTYASPPFTIVGIQPILNQTVQVLPPYTKKLTDYFSASKVRSTITVMQYPSEDAMLHLNARIRKTDQSITIASDSYASVSIKKTGGVFPPYTLTQADIIEVFRYPVAEGITMEELQRNGLPDGSYELCFDIRTPDGRTLGTFCSPPFLVSEMIPEAGLEIEPPIIIQPYDGSELLPEQAGTLQFTWTRPPGSPPETQYRLKMIELINPRPNYRDMLRNNTYPTFFETTVGSVPTYLYTAANPALNKDRYYAFVVQAVSPIGTAPANFKNDGYSEPSLFSFQKDKSLVPGEIVSDVPPRDPIPPSEEGLVIFVPDCPNCNQGQNDVPFTLPTAGTTYQLLGNTLNPNLAFAGANAGASASATTVSVNIPADAVAVNNARNFFLRWEDKSRALAKLQPQPGEGIVYRLQVRDASNNRVVWTRDVWNSNSYEQTQEGLPFRDGGRYLLHIDALRGTVAQTGFNILLDKTGKPETIASSCNCAFTFMKLPDIPDLEEYTVKGKLSYKFEHHPEKYPLTTTTATLTRYTKPAEGGGTWYATPKDDRHAVPIRINDDGTFEVTVHAYPNNGLIPADPSIITMKPIDLREFFNLELNSPYYRSFGTTPEPPTVVNLTDKIIDLGEITFNVWSYTLEVEVSKGYSKYGGDVTGTYRELTPQDVTGYVSRLMFGLEGFEDVPYYEGDIPADEPKSQYGKGRITDGKVEIKKGDDGKEHTFVTFDRLICNFQSNDRYLIDISQELEVDGKKKKYEINEFRGVEGFQYRPDSKELILARALNKSNFLVKEKATLIDDAPPRSSVKGRLVFADPSVNRNQTQPLANTDIALVVTYLILDDQGHSTVMDPNHLMQDKTNKAVQAGGAAGQDQDKAFQEFSEGIEDRNMVLATTRTDANGDFEFKDFANIDSVYTEQFKKMVQTAGGEFYYLFNADGRLKRTVRVVVNNSEKRSWLNPNRDIDVQPNTSVDVSTLVAYLDTYKLRVKPVGDPTDKFTVPDKKGKILKDVFVNIQRDPIYQGEPAEKTEQEDYVKNDNGLVFSVPRHRIDQKGYLGVNEDVATRMFNELKIRAFTKDTVGEQACYTRNIQYPRDYYEDRALHKRYWPEERLNQVYSKVEPSLFKSQNDSYLFVDDYRDVTYDLIIAMHPQKPIISGRVLDAENMSRSVERGQVLLKTAKLSYFARYDYANTVQMVSAGFTWEREVSEAKGNGYFSFDDLIPNVFIPGTAVTEPIEVNNLNDLSTGTGRYGLCQGSSDYQLFVKARGYTLAEFKQEGQETVKNPESKWFPAEPLKPKMGQQFHFPAILMGPDGWITGCVTDEEGNALEALAKTTRSVLIETKDAPPGKGCPPKVVQQMSLGNSSGHGRGNTVSIIEARRNWFRVPAPSGYSDTLFVMPRNISKYFSDTLFIPAMPEGAYDVGTVELKERKHRIRIVAIPYIENPTHLPPGIPGLTVKIEGAGEAITNEDGVAEFKFVNNATNFHYEIIPPEESDYIAMAGELTNRDSKEMVTYRVMLKKGATVSGRVTTDGQPVPGADVWVFNGNEKRQVKADEEGYYKIRGIKPVRITTTSGSTRRGGVSVPVLSVSFEATIHCGPPDDNPDFSNLRGLDKNATFQTEDGAATLDFELEIFYKANIRSLHGFGITVTDIKEDGEDNYRITGSVQLDKVPSSFEAPDRIDQNPQFKDLKVRASEEKDEKERPYLEAVGGSYGIGLKQMDVTLKAGGGHDYSVELGNEGDAFLNVTADGVTGGFIRSKARIKPNSFSFTDVDLTFDENQFYLSDIAGEESADGVTSFKRYLNNPETEEEARSFRLHDREGGPMQFQFIAFEATSPLRESLLGTDGVITLKPDVWFINPLLKKFRNDTIRLNLPEIKMTPNEINRGGVEVDELTFEFEQWKIVAKNCTVDASRGGIVSKDVLLRTGSLDFPAKNLLLNKEVFLLNEFEIDRLPLGKNIAFIDIEPDCSFQFSVDPKCGMDHEAHLMISLVNDGGKKPVGGVKNLPGFGQDLVFQSIKLTSDGGQVIGFAPDCEKIRLYDVVDFLPFAINSHEDSFNVDGAIDYGIPRIPTNINYKLNFTKGRFGRINMEIGGSDVSFKQVGTFNSLMSRQEDLQSITDGLVELHGAIHEPGHLEPIRVIVWKKRTAPNQYRIWMERENPKKAQTIRLGGTGPGEPEFLVEKADMIILPDKNDWDLLRLKLVPSDTYGGNSGLGTKPMYFELGGEMRTDMTVSPEDQQIALVGTDIDPETNEPSKSGLTGFKFVYDFPTQQFLGSMTIVDQNIGGVKFGGVLEMAIGKPGFYFACAGTMQTSPWGKINAGFLIGYYDQQIPTHIWQKILQYSARNEVPCSLTGDNFRGFYALGAIGVPFFTFDYAFDFGVAKGGINMNVAAEASVYASFQPGKNILGVSAMIYADAQAYLEAITCTSIDAKVRATIKGETSILLNEPYTASLTLCGDMLVSGCLKQEIPWVDTEGFTCITPPDPIPHKIDFEVAAHAGLTASIDLKGGDKPRVDKISYGAGLCGDKMGCSIDVDNYTKKTCD